jgi:hypothetical protein
VLHFRIKHSQVILFGLLDPEDEGDKILPNTINYLLIYMAQHPRRLKFSVTIDDSKRNHVLPATAHNCFCIHKQGNKCFIVFPSSGMDIYCLVDRR